MPASDLISARGIGFKRGHRDIITRLSLGLRTDELTVVVGPNGAGKSTLLRLLTGDLRPHEGQIVFDGLDLTGWKDRSLARRRAVMSQSTHVAFPFTVEEIVGLGLDQSGAGRQQATISEILNLVGLAGFAGRPIQQLSGGEQQRVHLARVFCQLFGGDRSRPQYLFLDEPTSSLDIRHQVQTLDLVRSHLSPQLGALVILHDLNLALAYADRLIVLHRGHAAADGEPKDIMTSGLLSHVYGVNLEVLKSAGGLMVVARRAAGPELKSRVT